MKSKKLRIISIVTMLTLAISASFLVGYASWQFNQADTTSEITNVGVSKWTFTPVEDGSNIHIDSNGNVTITDDEGNPVPAEAEVTYPDGTNIETNGGTVNIDIGTNENGDLVVTDYSATDVNGNSVLIGGNSSVSFPESIVINGNEYPVVAINTPVTISASNGAFWAGSTCSITVPNGYVSICDNAFQNVSASTGFLQSQTTFTYHLPSSLEYLGNHAIKLNVAGGSVKVQYAGTRDEFIALVNASAAAYTGGGTYCFFTANGNTRCTVTCSGNQTVTYNQNGTIYN